MVYVKRPQVCIQSDGKNEWQIEDFCDPENHESHLYF